jgi:hypothetical protein
MPLPDSLASLATRLINLADYEEAFGETEGGQVMRLAAAVITEFESTMNAQLSTLEAEVRRLESEIHHA